MSKIHKPSVEGKVPVRPVLLGPKNCEAAVGAPWRWVRDQAAVLGVPLVGSGRKQFVRADLFLAALEAANETTEPPAELDAAEQVRRLIGVSR